MWLCVLLYIRKIWLNKNASSVLNTIEECNYFMVWQQILHCIAKNIVLHGRTKHIDIKFNFVPDLVIGKIVKLKHYNTKSQLDDIFTKPIIIHKHFQMRIMLVVYSLQSRGECVGMWLKEKNNLLHWRF